MRVSRWPSTATQWRLVAVSFVLTPVCLLLALGLLALAGPATDTAIGTPLWHGTWISLLTGRAALVCGLALYARQPLRGKRTTLARTAQGLATLALAVGIAGYVVALYGPNLALLPGSEAAIAAGEGGVLAAIVAAVSGGLTLAGHLLVGGAVATLALSTAAQFLRVWAALAGVAVGVTLVAVAAGGLLTIGQDSVVLSTTLALLAYCWVAGLGIVVRGRGREAVTSANSTQE